MTSYLNDPLSLQERLARAEARDRLIDSLFLSMEDQLLDYPFEWLIGGLLPCAYLAVLAGVPKSGKTAMATALALAVATGTPFAGRQTSQSPVLWLAAEESLPERRQLLRQSPLAQPDIPLYTCYEHVPIDTDEGLGILERWIHKTCARLIVVDPLIAATSGRSLDSAWNARKSLKALKRFIGKHRVSAVVLHHAKSGGPLWRGVRVADSEQLSAVSSVNWILSHRLADSPSRVVRLETHGRGEFANRVHYFQSVGALDYEPLGTYEEEWNVRVSRCANSADHLRLVMRAGPLTAREMANKMELTYKTVLNVLTHLRAEGEITIISRRNGERLYALTSTLSPEATDKAHFPDETVTRRERKTGKSGSPTSRGRRAVPSRPARTR